MFRIGEFSRLTQVTVRMLRYYDETGLLRPARVDSRTGYRLYETRQIPRLNQIIYLRDSGFNVAEIAAALEAEDEGLLAEQLDRKSGEIGAEIEACRQKLRKLETARRALLNGSGIHFDISVKPVAECLALSLRRTIPDYYSGGSPSPVNPFPSTMIRITGKNRWMWSCALRSNSPLQTRTDSPAGRWRRCR